MTRDRRLHLIGLGALLSALVSCGPGTGLVIIALSAGSDDSGGSRRKPSGSAPRGQIDLSFGGGGFVVHDGAAGGADLDRAWEIAVDAQGRIVVAGDSMNAAGDRDAVVWRFLDHGVLDPGFGTQGWVVHDNAAGGGGSDWAGGGLAIDTQGRICVGGSSDGGVVVTTVLVVWRFLEDGTLDPSFSGSGFVTYDDLGGGNRWDAALDLVLDDIDRILVTGQTHAPGPNLECVVLRLTPSGTLDGSFGPGGFVLQGNTAGGDGPDLGTGIAIDSQGRIVVAGRSWNPSGDVDMVVWRFLPDGTLDSAVVHGNAAGGMDADAADAVAVDRADRAVAVGTSTTPVGDDDLALWRVTAAGVLDGSFGSGGVVTSHDAAGGDDQDAGNDVVIDDAGGILVAGSSRGVGVGPEMVIWRFLPGGSPDGGFGTGGVAIHGGAAGGVNGADFGEAITLDHQGRILVAGWSDNGTDYDIVVWRYE